MSYDMDSESERNSPREGDVQVFVRFRPLNKREQALPSQSQIWKQANDQELQVKRPVDDASSKGLVAQNSWQNYRFDKILPEETSQEEMYNALARPLVNDILDGYNCSLLAYGMTGSGKTTTMMGLPSKDGEGVVPRLMNDLFEHMEQNKSTHLYNVTCSAIEIYMEKIQDLLKAKNQNLKLREVVKKHKRSGKTLKSFVYVENCSIFKIKEYKDMKRLIRKADAQRTTAATAMNPNSSRSHSVFILNVEQTDLSSQTRKNSKVFLVDLAGSEQVSRSKVQGMELKQATYVNKSLTTLALVIRSLTSKEKGHVPYRNSKLTRLLTDALGGNSRTALILTCSPSEDNLRETVSTLNFGKRAKHMENSAKMNQDLSLKAYRKLVATLQREVKALKVQLAKEQNMNTVLTRTLKDHNVEFPTFQSDGSEKIMSLEEWNERYGPVAQRARVESSPLPAVPPKPEKVTSPQRRRRKSIPFKIEESDIEEPKIVRVDSDEEDARSTISNGSMRSDISSTSTIQYYVMDDLEEEPQELKVEYVDYSNHIVDPQQDESLPVEDMVDFTVQNATDEVEEIEMDQVEPIHTFPDDLDDLCLTSMQDVLIWSTDDLFYFKDIASSSSSNDALTRPKSKKIDSDSPFTVPRKNQ